jgi:DNA-binding transcriptional LysR family regulator
LLPDVPTIAESGYENFEADLWNGLLAPVNVLHVPYRGSPQAITDLLGGQVQVMFDLITSSMSKYDSIIAACIRSGFTPKLGQEAPQIVATIPLVAAGLGVSVVPQSITRIHPDGVVYLSIDGDVPHSLISLARRRDDRSPAVRNFVAVARRATKHAD